MIDGHNWRRRAPLINLSPEEYDDDEIVVVHPVDGGRAIDNLLEELRAGGRTPRTIERYRRTLNQFLDALPGDVARDLVFVTRDDCERFIQAGRALSTQTFAHAVLSRFFRWLLAQGKLERNPLAGVSRPVAAISVGSPNESEVVIENEALRDLSWLGA